MSVLSVLSVLSVQPSIMGHVLLAALAATVSRVSATSSRKAKAELVAAALRQAEPAERRVVVRWLEGELPQRRTGLGWRSLADPPPPAPHGTLAVLDVDEAMSAAQAEHGPGSQERRRALLRGLLAAGTADEQRLVAGLVSGELRQGAQRGVLVEAVALAAEVPVTAVRRALTLVGDVAEVADVALSAHEAARGLATGAADAGTTPREAAARALAAVRLRVGRPVSPMLAASAPAVADALARTGEAVVEWKLDGVRVQVHRREGPTPEEPEVRVWTRSLEEITERAPEVVAAVAALPATRLVLDGEVLGLAPGPPAVTAPEDGGRPAGGPGRPSWWSRRPAPFQQTSSRVAAGAGGAGPSGALELALVLFDVLHRDGRDLLDAPQRQRRAELEELAPHCAVPALVVRAGDEGGVDAAEAFAADALARGHEGVVVKDASTPYAAGRRGAGWVKVKPRLTLDLVVLAVERGSGRRTGTLSNLHLGARDPHGRFGLPGGFVMLGKTFKGLTDAMLAWQTERLAQLAVHETRWRVDVRHELVVEVAFDGVQDSPRYPAGLALRFARVVAHRPDKPAAEADTVETVEALHAAARTGAAGAGPARG